MNNAPLPLPLTSRRCGPLSGQLTPPGDKSISHRAIMLGGVAKGVTTVKGLLEGEDVLCTVAVLRALGAKIGRQGDLWSIEGASLAGLREPEKVLDVGNSGTSARLLTGLLGARPFTSVLTGDASLCKRPMGRVIAPLEQMGARFISRAGGKLPLAIAGALNAAPIRYRLPIASAQVKSAVLLAGLSAQGETSVLEAIPTRDHTENMLRHFGATLTVESCEEGERITVEGPANLYGQTITVPADISSAAFPLVGALIRPGSTVTLLNVGINPRRSGLIPSLQEMGADISILRQRTSCGEPVADLMVRAGELSGVTIPAERAPSMIDEYPILFVAAACAQGTTRLCGLGELRVKESDRLALMAQGLQACGVDLSIEGDDLIIRGTGKPPQGGTTVATAMDHRIAMSFLVLGMAAQDPISVDDSRFIATSFPNFSEAMNQLGAHLA